VRVRVRAKVRVRVLTLTWRGGHIRRGQLVGQIGLFVPLELGKQVVFVRVEPGQG